MDPTGRLVHNPKVPHATYPTQIGGQHYVGGLDRSIPRDVMFPDFYAKRRAANIPPLGDDRAFGMSDVSQDANQEWLDGVMRYLSRSRQAD